MVIVVGTLCISVNRVYMCLKMPVYEYLPESVCVCIVHVDACV